MLFLDAVDDDKGCSRVDGLVEADSGEERAGARKGDHALGEKGFDASKRSFAGLLSVSGDAELDLVIDLRLGTGRDDEPHAWRAKRTSAPYG